MSAPGSRAARFAVAAAGLLAPTLARAQVATGPSNENAAVIFLAVIVVVLIIFEIPAIVAFWRRHPNRWLILIVNTTLGGTGIVWLGCLVWAFKALHLTDDPTGSNGGESGLNLTANDAVRVRFEGNLPPTLPPPLYGASTARPDAIERLERLKKLLDDGVIDQQQFDRMRGDVVAGS